MNKIKLVLKFIPFLALIFVLKFFYNVELNLRLEYREPILLISSIITIGFVFWLRIYKWHLILQKFNIQIPFRLSFLSYSKTILTKFIPGKIWTIAAQAHIINLSDKKIGFKKITLVSLTMQIYDIYSGMFVGAIGLLMIYNKIWLNALIISSLFLSIFIFKIISNKKFYLPESVFRKIGVKYLKIPFYFDYFLLTSFQWLLLGFAFALFYNYCGIKGNYISISLLQTLANNIGIIAFIAPSGLGVREGASIWYMSRLDIPLVIASNLVILSRIWFTICELILYLVSIFFKNNSVNYEVKNR